MNEVNKTIFNLNEIQESSKLKEIIDEYKILYQQISEERTHRIEVIEELRIELLEIYKKNKELKISDEFKSLISSYKKQLYNICEKKFIGLNDEDVAKKVQEEKEALKNDFDKSLENMGYVSEELVTCNQLVIENYIKSLYKKYVCEIFGHEYQRDKNGNLKEFTVGYRRATVESDASYYGHGRVLDEGNAGKQAIVCKCCGETIYKNIFAPDFHDKQKILLPNSNN